MVVGSIAVKTCGSLRSVRPDRAQRIRVTDLATKGINRLRIAESCGDRGFAVSLLARSP